MPAPSKQGLVNVLERLWRSGHYETKAAACREMFKMFPEALEGYSHQYSAEQAYIGYMREQAPELAEVRGTYKAKDHGDTDQPSFMATALEAQQQANDGNEMLSLLSAINPSLESAWNEVTKGAGGNHNVDTGRELETLQAENKKLFQQVIRNGDRVRGEMKQLREMTRLENSMQELHEASLKIWRNYGRQAADVPVPLFVPSGKRENRPVLLQHISDVHFNELIDMPDNKWDFKIASRRFQKLAAEIKLMGAAFGANKLIVAFGGDLMNSDRRLDENENKATTRAQAVHVAGQLLRYWLQDLRKSFEIETFGVVGNEGRVGKEMPHSRGSVLNSFDYLIYTHVQAFFEGMHDSQPDPGMVVHDMAGNELTISVCGKEFLLIHGHQLNCNDARKVQAVMGRQAQKGTPVQHVLAGHIHATQIGDIYSRNSSLSGGNAYSGDQLQFASKAAQNLHVIDSNSHHTMKIDLQDTQGYDGYELDKVLERVLARNHDSQAYKQGVMRALVHA